jgi:hypothetical protein
MSKRLFTLLMLPLILLFCNSSQNSVAGSKQKSSESQTGTLEKMIVADGSVAMDIDLNRLNGISPATQKLETLRFVVKPNSFFTILVFNDLLRAAESGSMALIPQNTSDLPARLNASLSQLAIEKMDWGAPFDIVVRDDKTGFVFFNIEGNLYDYDANAQLLAIIGGRLLLSQEFANALGRPSDAGSVVGKISVGAAMQSIEITQLADGEPKSAILPAVGTRPGPDVIVGELYQIQEQGNTATQVGVAVGTISCNAGIENLNWVALPNTDHPVIPQNLYRMSGGATNNQRFEQVGQSWIKHAFTALTNNDCGFGCNGVGGSQLGSGCSDPYSAGLNGSQTSIGSRAWVNAFTGSFPSTANNHNGHAHDGVSHRVLIGVDDLNTTLNPGATYFAEAQYVTPHEYSWCQTHPGQCNMYNNASYRQVNVSGINPPFSFSFVGNTVREQPAIMAWTGATVNPIEPDPGNDGIWFIAYKVTNPSPGVWHYEYALHNENLDRAIQSFSVPLGPGVNISNTGFHAPPQHPGWANDGTQGGAGYSSTPWDVTQDASSITWSAETFAQNQNANAIRWGTLYNFRFDADQPPQNANATVGFFKTGSPMSVAIQAPVGVGTPTPTPTASPTPTPTASPTPTATSTPTATPTPTPPPRPRPTPGATPPPHQTPPPRP